MSFENFRSYQKEEQNKKDEEQEIPQEYTLKGILNNQERSNLFTEKVTATGDPALVERLIDKKLTEDDLEALESHREEFVETLKQVKKIKENISPEIFKDIINNSDALERFVGVVGVDGVKNTILKKLENLAFEDAYRFNQINEAVGAVMKHGEKTKKKDEEVATLCKKYNVSEDKLYTALNIEDEKERRKAVKAVVKEKMGFWKKGVFDIAHTVTMNRVDVLDKRKDFKKLSADLDKKLKTVGNVLSMTISGNDMIRQTLQEELLGEKADKDSFISFNKGRDDINLFESKTQTDIENEFKSFVQKDKKIRNYNNLPDSDKDSLINDFFDNKKKNIKGKKGILATVFSALFDFKKNGFDLDKLRSI